MLNHHLYREAEKKQKEVTKIVKYFTRLQKPASKERLARDYIDPMYELFEKIEFKQVPKVQREKRVTYSMFVDAQKELGNEVVLNEEMKALLANADKINYKDMTFAELRQVYDAVKNIETIARLEKQGLDEQAALDFQESVDAMVEEAFSKISRKEQPPNIAKSKLKLFKDGWEAFGAEHDKLEYVLEAMDNFKAGGIWWNNMFKPIADASDREMEMNEQFIDKMKVIMLDRYTRKERNAWNKKVSTRVGQFNKKNIIAIALNWGNADNRLKLIDGFLEKKSWDMSELDIETMLDNHMEQRDWDMVQDVWVMIDELWPEIAALQKELTGVVPEKVVATPFNTKFGVMAGGYYPLKYDNEYSRKQDLQDQAQADKELFTNSSTSAATRKNHTKGRVESTGKFVRLDLDVLSEHMHDVIHDLTHRKAVRYVAKLIRNEDITRAIQESLGTSVYSQFYPWLKNIAAPEPNYMGGLERAANWTRHSSTIVAMGFKVTTAIQQPLGYLQTVNQLGEKWAAKGLKNFYKNPIKQTELIFGKSVYMRNRSKTLDRDIRDSVKRIAAGDSKLKDMQSKYFFFIGFLDMSVSLPSWQGAYEKSIWEGMSEKDAIAQGDSVVRMSQGSGEKKDLAKITAGHPLLKLFTQFYTYFSAYYNATSRTKSMYQRGEISAWQAFKSFTYLSILPAILSSLIVGRGPDEDEDESWGYWALKEVIQFPFMGMVGIRDGVSYLFNPYFGTALPYTDVFENIVDGTKSILDIMTDDEFNNKDVEKIMLGLGYLFKLPARQITNMEAHLYEVFSENEDFSLFEFLVKIDRKD